MDSFDYSWKNDEPDKKTTAITTKKNYKKTYEEYSAMREQYKKEYSKGAKDADLERAQSDIDLLFEDSVDVGMQDLDKFALLLLKVLKEFTDQISLVWESCPSLSHKEWIAKPYV